ncbi:hypothetical protein Kpol_526p25 [Vanderwaltozyma polyspora DSM 70294]|uniref:Uncharacterized protein n=1 Tax=Vanderwaltozyma polyspora (strain ATCC 22028 / DSM 70294 / BCRC 21397 / CBS 2163 / NBRC 10782 / NRRL Y-8283 / UCD 57-17) TaxID=436907 RepID=A7TLT0_VANPO|nr:uncharacterized protein Kpol_526p25 [Vanderwaltozyma polyspora DSM 70294]EDO16772.1 hypothetical protein Kpol_526p25 [Vanderwaltozyma polyspora DSM 70294]
MFKPVISYSSRYVVGRHIMQRQLSTSYALMGEMDKHLKQKPILSSEERQEQNMFNKNKAILEKMEHDKLNHDNELKPDMETLKQFGDNARIEQNRPDDGVY